MLNLTLEQMEIAEAIKRLSRTNEEVYSIVGKVSAVDQQERTCTVKPVNGDADILRARLQSILNGEVGIVIYPAIDSLVVVTFLNKETGYVAMCSEIDSVVCTIEGQELEYNNKGLFMGSDVSNLRKEFDLMFGELSKLIDTLIKFQLSTNVGPTISVMPQIITALNGHKTNLKSIQSNLQSFIH